MTNFIDNILTEKEIDELSKKKEGLKLAKFEDFFGIDGDLYFKQGGVLKAESYIPVGITTLAVPKGTENGIISRAIEERRIKQSNAYLCKYELTVNSNFSLTHYKQGFVNDSSHDIFSILYIRADEEKLKELIKKSSNLY